MLKLSLRPGEYIDIGENVRVIFSGGSANNIHLLVDAPREVNIARSSASGKTSGYYRGKRNFRQGEAGDRGHPDEGEAQTVIMPC